MAPRERGKFSKPSRGGGKHYSRDVQPVDKHGNLIGMWRDPEDIISSSGEEEYSSEGSSEEEEDTAGSSNAPAQETTREQRRAAAKARKEAAAAKKLHVTAQPGDLPSSESEEAESDDELPANPNHSAKLSPEESQGTITNSPDKASDPSQLSRREREAIQAQQARERYLKLHAEGKTDEARADLARLAIVRERREAEKARKEAEREEKEAREQERAKAREQTEKVRREAALGISTKGGKKVAKK